MKDTRHRGFNGSRGGATELVAALAFPLPQIGDGEKAK